MTWFISISLLTAVATLFIRSRAARKPSCAACESKDVREIKRPLGVVLGQSAHNHRGNAFIAQSMRYEVEAECNACGTSWKYFKVETRV